jgi:glyoxylase-like metal-dependent hydrolase (beta-lactamase superfamily II)
MAGARNERPVRRPITPAGTVREGGTIFGLRVIATPGHGKHAVSYLLDTADGVVAFCGDLVCGADGRMWNWFDCEWDYGCHGGPIALLASARRLLDVRPAMLCPAHGDAINDPVACLTALTRKLEAIIDQPPPSCADPVNFPNIDSPAQGFRMISPRLHQWKTGNLAVLLSDSGAALFIDDGLCNWIPLPERAAAHRRTVESFKKALGVSMVEIVIPTHYHGDHTENIPWLVAMEGAEVVSLDLVAEPMEHPEKFNLTCLLPWYDVGCDVVKVDRAVPDGYRLKWREYELEIFHLGGQTNYHAGIATVVDGRRVVFTGDSCFPNSKGCEPVICWNDASPFTKGYPYAFERLIERAPDLLVSAHGMSQLDPLPYLLRKRDAWRAMRPVYESLSARNSLDEFFTPHEMRKDR